jgi:hypothetical protein
VRAAGGAKERRKPARGGEALGTVAGSLRESEERALVDGRRLGSGKPFALTRGRWKRFWLFVLCSAMGNRGERQGASEAGSSALGAADNATPGRLCLRAEPFSSFVYVKEG